VIATKLTIMRHGETEWNGIGKQQGHLDSPLTENGIKQAEAVRDWIGNDYDLIISSDLGRAMQTAAIIAEKHELKIIAKSGLRERNLGILQGLTMEEFRAQYPLDFEQFNSDDPDYVIPSGESARQRFERAINTFNEIRTDYNGSNVFIVTHGGIIESLFRFVLGIPLAQKRTYTLRNGSLNKFFHEERWMLDSWGDINHLKGIAALDDF